jgi:hypothetical protein
MQRCDPGLPEFISAGSLFAVMLGGLPFGPLQISLPLSRLRKGRLIMRFDEYRRHDAVGLAGLIARREVGAGDVLEAAIARAEQVNPAINAIVHTQYERARATTGNGLANSTPASRLGSAAACTRTSSPIMTAPIRRGAGAPAWSSSAAARPRNSG